MIFQLKRQQVSLDFADQYADVFLHLEDKTDKNLILKANKVILAFHSKYFHRIFQSRENIQAVDFGFVGISSSTVRNAIQMMYGDRIEISEKDQNRFRGFLNRLEVDFDSLDVDKDNASLSKSKHRKRTNETVEDKEENIPVQIVADSQPASKKSNIPMSVIPATSQFSNKLTETISPSIFVESSSTSASISATNDLCTSNIKVLTAAEGSNTKSEETVETVETVNLNPKEIQIKPKMFEADSMFTTRRGEPANFDNWTVTSDLQVKLNAIDFRLVPTPEGLHDNYICCHCGKIVKSVFRAESHFAQNHQKRDKEIKIMQEAMKYNSEAAENIANLKKRIDGGFSKPLVANELW